MYKFIKLQDKSISDLIYPYYFYCDTIEKLIDHMNIYLRVEISKGIKDLFNKFKSYEKGLTSGHWSTIWSQSTIKISQTEELNWLEASCLLENDIFKGRLKCLFKYGNICLSENGLSYMVYKEDLYNIIDFKNMKELKYPSIEKYLETDITIFQWPNGNHFYSKIRNIDVVDMDNNQKWNTYTKAMEVSKRFLKKLNNKEIIDK